MNAPAALAPEPPWTDRRWRSLPDPHAHTAPATHGRFCRWKEEHMLRRCIVTATAAALALALANGLGDHEEAILALAAEE